MVNGVLSLSCAGGYDDALRQCIALNEPSSNSASPLLATVQPQMADVPSTPTDLARWPASFNEVGLNAMGMFGSRRPAWELPQVAPGVQGLQELVDFVNDGELAPLGTPTHQGQIEEVRSRIDAVDPQTLSGDDAQLLGELRGRLQDLVDEMAVSGGHADMDVDFARGALDRIRQHGDPRYAPTLDALETILDSVDGDNVDQWCKTDVADAVKGYLRGLEGRVQHRPPQAVGPDTAGSGDAKPSDAEIKKRVIEVGEAAGWTLLGAGTGYLIFKGVRAAVISVALTPAAGALSLALP